MQFLLLSAVKILFGVVLGVIFIPIWVLLVLPYSAVAALFDGESYCSALWKRMKDSAEVAYTIGRIVGAGLPSI